MKWEEKDQFIEKYGALAIKIRGAIPWEEVRNLKDVVKPEEGNEVYVNSHSVYRRGVVVKVGRTRATVMLTTDGAVTTATRSRLPVHFTFATQPISTLRAK